MQYPFNVYKTQVEDHVFWIAESTCLKGCVGQGDNLEDAVNELDENESVWLETAKEIGLDIPNIPVYIISEYSGKFTIRVAPSVHRAASEYAKKESISLNQYVNDAIVSQNARFETLSYVAPEVKNAISVVKSLAESAQTN